MRELPAVISVLAGEIVAKNPVHAQFLQVSLNGITGDALDSLREYVEYCLRHGRDVAYLADCYNTIVNDTRSEQFFFLKHGRYRYSRYDEVANRVYLDPEYMDKYMYGLALTAFLWPNHAQMYEFFVKTFPAGKRGAYLEVGPGHGYYLRRAAELGAFDLLVGIDVSPTSVAMTRDILGEVSARSDAEIRIVQADFLSYSAGERSYSCVVMGEVLEHVEEPARFLQTIAGLSDAQTHIFVTTCVNAPAVDHIYLFPSTKAVENLIERCGFDIEQTCYVPYAGKTLEECAREALAINTAYVLRKR